MLLFVTTYLYHKEAFLHNLVRVELHLQKRKDRDSETSKRKSPNDVKDWTQSSLPKFPNDSKIKAIIRVVKDYIKLTGN